MVRLTANDIEHSARILLHRHGDAAPGEARRQAESCDPHAPGHGMATWFLIAEMCEELLAAPLPEDAAISPAL